MRILVQKYGGSSVSSLEKIEIIAQRLVHKQAEGWRVVVVVSAMGNTTDELLNLARRIIPQPPARELDMLLSTGERTTMALLSIAIQKYGAQAISFTGSQSGIVTNDSHAHAKIISVRPYRIQDELERGKIVIVAGYQGTSYKNEITTLGRGGSDMTAIALAGALSANACEIYSDVDGVYSADPKLVLDAKRIDELSASEMLVLAQHGAKVLHDEAVAYARKHGIALYAKATQLPDSPGTLIRPDDWPDYALKSASIRPIAVSTAKQILFFQSVGKDFQVFLHICAQWQSTLKFIAMTQNEAQCTAILDTWNCASAQSLIKNIKDNCSEAVICLDDVSNVSLIGQDIGRELGLVQEALDCLQEAQIECIYTSIEPNALTFIVSKALIERCSTVLHGLIQ